LRRRAENMFWIAQGQGHTYGQRSYDAQLMQKDINVSYAKI